MFNNKVHVATIRWCDNEVQDDNIEKLEKKVCRPKHYNVGGTDAIGYMKEKFTKEQLIGFLKGNIIKYLTRLGIKGDCEDTYKDAMKITQYAALLEEAVYPEYGDLIEACNKNYFTGEDKDEEVPLDDETPKDTPKDDAPDDTGYYYKTDFIFNIPDDMLDADNEEDEVNKALSNLINVLAKRAKEEE